MTIYKNKTVQQYCVIVMALAIASFTLIMASKWDTYEGSLSPVIPKTETKVELSAAEIKMICSADNVVCEGKKEATVAKKATVAKTIAARVSTYQAVAGQTDSTPCVGAMAGINFCNPPYPIVAANGYKFGTKVRIRGVVYTVADRMNSRYGKDHFDILTDGKNYLLRNEPVEIIN